MKYITQLILTNFQSHKYSKIDFNSGLNIVVGPSDSGKTAILRAMKWALFNEPLGDYFIREGESECSVEISFNDGTRIKRYRSKSKNIYYLYDKNHDEYQFEGFASSVPQEIIEATGIKKILLDRDTSKSINLSEQLEGSFLLSEKSSTRANSIGRLVGVNILDDALRDSLKDSRNLANNKKLIDDKILNLEEELKDYDYLIELEERINKIEVLRNHIDKNHKLLSRYKLILEDYRKLEKEKNSLSQVLKSLDKVDLLQDLSIKISDEIRFYDSLLKKKEDLNKVIKNKNINIEIKDSLTQTNRVEGILEEILRINDSINKLSKFMRVYSNIKKEIKNLHQLSNKLKGLNIIDKSIDKIENNFLHLNRLLNVEDKYSNILKRLSVGTSFLENFKDLENIDHIYDFLEDKYKRLSTIKKINDNYLNILKAKNDSKLLIVELKKELDKLLLEYRNLLLNMEVCPLCFTSISEDKIHHIISHYD